MWFDVIEDLVSHFELFGSNDIQILRTQDCFDDCKFVDIALEIEFKDNGLQSQVIELINGLKYVENAELIEGRYLNIRINTPELAKLVLEKCSIYELERVFKQYGQGRKIIIEFISANPWHPLHLGHLRNAILGQFLVNLYELFRFKVEKHYYTNDLGKQGAVLLAYLLKHDKFNDLLSKNEKPDHLIGKLYVEANRWYESSEEAKKLVNELMYEIEKKGNQELLKKLHVIVNKCLEGQLQTLKLLDISFDYFTYESEFVITGFVYEIVNKLLQTGYAIIDNGQVIVDLLDKNLGKVVLTRSDGATLYVTRDIAYSIWKLSREVDKVINVIAEEQTLPQAQLREILKLLGYDSGKLIHYSYSRVIVTEESNEGKKKLKMSGRKGTYITIDELIKNVKERTKELLKSRGYSGKDLDEAALKIAIACIKYAILSIQPRKNLGINLTKIIDITENTGAYILYTYCRLKSIIEKARGLGISELKEVDYSRLNNEIEKKLLIGISKLKLVLTQALKEQSSHVICKYLHRSCNLANTYYEEYRIVDLNDLVTINTRLRLVYNIHKVLKFLLKILSIPEVEKL